MDVEEEEIQVKEVEKEVVTEVTVQQVRSRYPYQGQGMGFEKGEVSGCGQWKGACHSVHLLCAGVHSAVQSQR